MERIEQYYNKTYPPLRLYIDDLRIVYDSLAALYPAVIIKSISYKYSDWNDFRTQYKNEPGLVFMIERDNQNNKYEVIVEFTLYHVIINTEGTKPTDIAHTFIQLDKLFESKKRRQFNFPLLILTLLCIFITCVFVTLKFTIWNKSDTVQTAITVFCIPIFLSFFFTGKTRNKIHLYSKADKKNIFERTKDDIFSNVVASLITTILGIVIGYLIGQKFG